MTSFKHVVNFHRAKRSTIQYYQHFYEERAKALEQIVNNHKEKCSFEDFIAQVRVGNPRGCDATKSRGL